MCPDILDEYHNLEKVTYPDVWDDLDEYHKVDEGSVRMFWLSVITWMRDVSRSLG